MTETINAIAAERALRERIDKLKLDVSRANARYQELAYLAETGDQAARQQAAASAAEITQLQQDLRRAEAAQSVAVREALKQRKEHLSLQREGAFRSARAGKARQSEIAAQIDERLIDLAQLMKEFAALGDAAYADVVYHQPDHARHILAPLQIGEFVLGRLTILADLAHVLGYVPGNTSIGNRLYDAHAIAVLAKADEERYIDRTRLPDGELA